MPEINSSVNRSSRPSDLRITDMRFVNLKGAPMHCILVKIYTNQGITGVGEIRDFGADYYAKTLKGRLLGENPCNVEKLFKRIKQHGGPARQAGGVSGIEMALWDLAGKAYGVPVYQLIGGKYRDSARVYCDAGVNTPHNGPLTGRQQGRLLKEYAQKGGFTMVKGTLSVETVQALHPGEVVLSAPLGLREKISADSAKSFGFISGRYPELRQVEHFPERNEAYYNNVVEQPYTFYRITERGLELYEQELADMREELGYEIPLAIDHV
ncbi:MAG: mandelate racemase/muconate lactonizing enzyme family protein, partial [Christensenellaceae bacterium]|nr:mandelate racemase/muconate lactonizing enzyme family protein [Christensenellaceae bacterium]